MACLEFSQFDADAFGLPFYRVKTLDREQLALEIAGLPAAGGFAADAKAPAEDVGTARLLMGLGFRKVSMQIRLTHDLKIMPPDGGAGISSRLDLPEDALWRHARNFRYDRFNQDPLLPREGTARLFFQWTRNSLTQGRKEIVHRGSDFCTFSMNPDGHAAIDLISVLDHGKGIGKALVASTLHAASRRGATKLHVVTECENYPAWNLYLKTGFRPTAFIAAFHLVRLP